MPGLTGPGSLAATQSLCSRALPSEAIGISIGQIPLTIHVPPGKLAGKIGQRYAAFFASAKNALPVFIECGERLSCGEAGDSFSISRHAATEALAGGWNFSYALEGGALWLSSSGAHFQGVRHEFAADSLLRILLSQLLLERDGFLLHAATIVRKGQACIFAGPSGTGKSTVARFSPPGSVLTDEISLLRCSEKLWQAYGTPFWGEFQVGSVNRAAPVQGIYALRQAPEDRLECLGQREALLALLPNVLFFSREKQATERMLRILVRIVQEVPFYRLHFRRQATFSEMPGL